MYVWKCQICGTWIVGLANVITSCPQCDADMKHAHPVTTDAWTTGFSEEDISLGDEEE
jgi:ABC-type ATPase with predicted acetyltransferase domain